MLRKMFVVSLVVTTLSIVSSVATEAETNIPVTGSALTPEWKKYNEQAEAQKAPKLLYVVTCKKMTKAKGKADKPKKITDNFKLKDKKLYVYTNWTNVFGPHTYSLKVYDPRKVLFYEWDCNFRHAGPGWWLWSPLFIKNAPASKLPGKWTAEISMDGILATKKEFSIGDTDVQYKQILLDKEAPAIGFSKFVVRGSSGKRFDWELPNFLARMMTVDYPNYRVLLPWTVNKDISVPPDMKIEDFVNNTINSEIFSDFVSKHNVSLFIMGSAYDGGTFGERKSFHVYIIDAKAKTIVRHCKTTWISKKARHDNVTDLIVSACNKVYRKMMKKAGHDIENILGRK